MEKNQIKTLRQTLDERVLVLDGAMGTMIQKYGLREKDFRAKRFAEVEEAQKGNNDLLCLTQPQVIAEIHRQYLEAGADIIETCSFNSQVISMADYGMQDLVEEINFQAACIARQEADAMTQINPMKPRFVVGSVGPTSKAASISPDMEDPAYRAVTFDQLAEAYTQQMTALIRGGVDALLIETVFDTLNAKAAILAAKQAMRLTNRQVEIMLSATLSDKAGRTLSGQTLDAFLASVAHADMLSIGLNCSFGATDMLPFLRELARIAPCFVSAYPNAGLPNILGEYDETPHTMAAHVQPFFDEGLVNIIGGCCGTSPQHIAAFAQMAQKATPRKPIAPASTLTLSGLEALHI